MHIGKHINVKQIKKSLTFTGYIDARTNCVHAYKIVDLSCSSTSESILWDSFPFLFALRFCWYGEFFLMVYLGVDFVFPRFFRCSSSSTISLFLSLSHLGVSTLCATVAAPFGEAQNIHSLGRRWHGIINARGSF